MQLYSSDESCISADICTVFDHLVNHGAYSEADAARLVREVASALDFLHGIGIVHNE
jgi:serine/threonine protein kinase